MLFKDVLDLLLREIPPKYVDIERPTEDTLVLVLKKVHQNSGEQGVAMSLIVLTVGILFLYRGILGSLEVVLGGVGWSWDLLFCIVAGGAASWWATRQLVGIDRNETSQKRQLLVALTAKGAELTEGTTNGQIKPLHYLDWTDVADILLERQKRVYANKHPYCIHIKLQEYEDMYWFEWELLGQEVKYCANVLKAIWDWQTTGTVPTNWNKAMDEEPPFMDLSDHLIDE